LASDRLPPPGRWSAVRCSDLGGDLTLPSEADARAQAELERLKDRLAEAAAATAAGDTNAANAALEAYAAIVNEATEDAGNDVSAAATLETGVRSNIDVLEVLVGRVPTDAARDAIQRAIDRSDSALDEMTGKPSGTPPAADPTRSPKPDKTDQPDKTANPNRPTDVPAAATEKPHPTPKVDPTTNAAATPEPDRIRAVAAIDLGVVVVVARRRAATRPTDRR
jgi:hypothetical protein